MQPLTQRMHSCTRVKGSNPFCLTHEVTVQHYQQRSRNPASCRKAQRRSIRRSVVKALLAGALPGKSICERAEELAVMPDPWRDEVQRMATRYELAAVAVGWTLPYLCRGLPARIFPRYHGSLSSFRSAEIPCGGEQLGKLRLF